jgi:hypothetical protein
MGKPMDDLSEKMESRGARCDAKDEEAETKKWNEIRAMRAK